MHGAHSYLRAVNTFLDRHWASSQTLHPGTRITPDTGEIMVQMSFIFDGISSH